ncbi:hypothetical protein C8J57DRAFT_1290887, partial [Mycena rebaudengoi]
MLEMYPGLRVGPTTKVRAMVVGNATLAEISVKYKLPDRLRVHPAQAIALCAVHPADVFLSFIGGLYTDQGLDCVKTWLDALFCPYLAAAYCVVRADHGLPPVSVPAADNCLPAPTPSPTLSAEASTTGHLALFNQRLQQENKHVQWLYSDQHPFGMDSSAPPASGEEAFQHGSKATPIWSVQVVVDGEVFVRGKGNTKKAARNEAAKQGLARMGLNV